MADLKSDMADMKSGFRLMNDWMQKTDRAQIIADYRLGQLEGRVKALENK